MRNSFNSLLVALICMDSCYLVGGVLVKISNKQKARLFSTKEGMCFVLQTRPVLQKFQQCVIGKPSVENYLNLEMGEWGGLK